MAETAANPESVPPVATASTDGSNELEAVLSVKVMVAVWLFRRVAALEVMVTVGATVLTARASDPAAELVLPAASEKLPTGTEMLAAPLNPTFGVKVAV